MNSCKLVPINPADTLETEYKCGNNLIFQQLNKIIAHPSFSNSSILCKFLTYVVKETLSGNANRIKEYTIAVNVLNKPKNFETQRNGIVRIHALRLRLALINYYRLTGDDKDVTIVIPKGKYVPIFQPAGSTVPVSSIKYIKAENISNKAIIAVLPFKNYERKFSRVAFTDCLGQTVAIELAKTNHFSVISYDVVKEMDPAQLKIGQLSSNLNIGHLLSGNVHFEGNHIRVYVTLMDMSNQHQVWSDIYSFNNNVSSYFELTDIICSRIIGSLRVFASDENHLVANDRRKRVYH
jgi:TolB-like protein